MILGMLKVAVLVLFFWVFAVWGWHIWKKTKQDFAEDKERQAARRRERGYFSDRSRSKTIQDIRDDYRKKRAADRVKRGYFSDDP